MLSKMSLCSVEEDGGSAASLDVEDDQDDLHSPTDVSEDSVEVRVTPIAGPAKRKLVQAHHNHQQQQLPVPGAPGAGNAAELRGSACLAPAAEAAARQNHCVKRAASRSSRTGPLASPASPKRRRPASPLSPFRPWSVPSAPPAPQSAAQEEPLALVKSRVTTATTTVPVIPQSARRARSPRRPRVSKAAAPAVPRLPRFSVEAIIGDVVATTPPRPPSTTDGRDAADAVAAPSSAGSGGAGGQPRNYKNMTRERRIEANARERTRVHTISAAFDTLRRTVPAYSHSQKLSKLSVLRIACSYILTLSRVAGMDYSADQSRPPVQECVDLVTRTIQTEGKLRRKRDD